MAHPKKRIVVLGVALCIFFLTAAIFLSTLRPQLAHTNNQVEFTSVEPAAGVEIRIPDLEGTNPIGETPFRGALNLPKGPHTYIASAPGYQSVTGEFTLDGSESLQVKIPPLARLGGLIEVRSNAAAQIFIGDQPSLGCESNAWTSLGRLEPGTYTVRAQTALGMQEKTVTVGNTSGARTEFHWGSRLVVTVAPTGVLSATVIVDQVPYAAPRDYSYQEITVQSFAEVSAEAPGYLPWSDVVFLQPGQTTTVTAILAVASTNDDEILAAYRHFWEVRLNGYAHLDSSAFPSVMTGSVLSKHEENVATLQSAGAQSLIASVEPHTPTITMTSATSVSLRVSYDYQDDITWADGHQEFYETHSAGVYGLVNISGTWYVATWTPDEPLAEVSPTPVAGGNWGDPGNDGGGGGDTGQMADRTTIEQIIFQSINCLRAESGLSSIAWDQGLHDAFLSIADESSRTFRDTAQFPQEITDRANALAASMGGRIIGWKGVALSRSPGNVGFAYDWVAYADRACETRYGTGGGEAWAGDFQNIAVIIGEPYRAGAFWAGIVIFVAR